MNIPSSLIRGRPRTLYLGQRVPCQVQLDGNALRIRAERQAEVSIPLRHVARIVLGAHVQMGLRELSACAQRGIPAIVLDPEGRILMRVFSGHAIDDGLRMRLDLLTERADWQERLENWLRHELRWINMRLARQFRVPHLARDPAALSSRCHQRLAERLGARPARILWQRWSALVHGIMQHQLLQRGVDARSEAWIADSLDLPHLLGELLAHQSRAIFLPWVMERVAAQDAAAPMGIAELVAHLETHRSRLERMGDALINRLHRWLMEQT